MSGDAPPPWEQLAHELRGPLGVVRGAVDELEGDELMMQLALRGTRQLEHLANAWQLLGGQEPQREQARLETLVREAVDLFGELEPRRRRQLELAVEGSPPPRALDRDRVTVGVARLLSHLVRACRETIQITVVADGVRFSAGGDLDVPEDLSSFAALWASSSRLATAVGVLAPVTARWEASPRSVLWVAG